MRHPARLRVPILGWVVFFLLAQAPPVAGQDLAHDFAGIPWAADLASVKGLREVLQAGEVVYFTRSADTLEPSSLQLRSAIYAFFQGKFFAVHLPVKTEEAFRQAKASLTADYGKPRAQYRLGQDIYIWQHETIKIKLKHDADTSSHKLAFYYTPLSAKLNEKQADEAAEKVIRP